MNHISRVAISTVLLAWTVCFTVAACENKSGKAREIASKAVERFHQEFNDPGIRDLHVINGISGHPEVIPRPHGEYVRNARARFGSFKSATEKNCKTTSRPAGIVVHLTLQSQFERGMAVEKISFLVTGTSAVLEGYSIESSPLTSQ